MADALEDGRVYLPKPEDRRRSTLNSTLSGASSTDGRLCCSTCVALMHAFNGPLVLIWRSLFALGVVSIIGNFFAVCVLLATPRFALLVQRNSLGGSSAEVAVLVFAYIIAAILLPLMVTTNWNAASGNDFDALATSNPKRIVLAAVTFILGTGLLLSGSVATFAIFSAIVAILTPMVLILVSVLHLRSVQRQVQKKSSTSSDDP